MVRRRGRMIGMMIIKDGVAMIAVAKEIDVA
jgi:hypothetical protein